MCHVVLLVSNYYGVNIRTVHIEGFICTNLGEWHSTSVLHSCVLPQ